MRSAIVSMNLEFVVSINFADASIDLRSGVGHVYDGKQETCSRTYGAKATNGYWPPIKMEKNPQFGNFMEKTERPYRSYRDRVTWLYATGRTMPGFTGGRHSFSKLNSDQTHADSRTADEVNMRPLRDSQKVLWGGPQILSRNRDRMR